MRDAPPKSRRNRPAKPPLSKEGIVDAAVQILRREGLAQVTTRRVAQALDTGAASLYVYIANTTQLHAELLDRLLGDLEAPPADGQEQLLDYLGRYSALLTAYPGLARSALTIRPSGPHYLRVHEVTAKCLVADGVALAPALWGADLLVLLVTASAAEHSTPPDVAAQPPPTLTAAHPLLSAHHSTAFGGAPQQRQRWQLQTIITGLQTAPMPPLQE